MNRWLALLLGFMMTTTFAEPLTPPQAARIPHKLQAHGDNRVDEYFWLNKRDNPEVIRYLNAENAYLEATLKHTETLQKTLYQEMKARIKEDDSSAPYRHGNYYYYTRFEKNKEYPIYCRKKGSLDAAEEILLDANQLAKGHSYFQVGGLELSPNHQMLAYAVDTQGRRIYTIHFKDLTTGKTLTDRITEVTPDMAWANDNQTLFYVKQNPKTLRSERLLRHALGSSQETSVYFEPDETFSLHIERSISDKYLLLGINSTLTTEYRYLNAHTPTGDWQVLQPRERGHEYYVSHADDQFFILSNQNARNFRVMVTKDNKPSKENWQEFVPHREDTLIESIEIFRNFFVLQERNQGLTRLRVSDRKSNASHFIDFGEATYSAQLGFNPEYDTNELRYEYDSLTTPSSTYDYGMANKQKILRKQKEILGGFNAKHYHAERLFATAEDGTQIPISLVYRKDIPKSATRPLLLYAYGSYGHSMDANFNPQRLSLLDRGFSFAIAHIRGGSEMGRSWYEDGKLLKKKNTFTDYIACASHLIKHGYTSPKHLYAYGGSAGGLLMGAIVNMRPDLFHGVIAAVPFVDVITTMLDSSIPLTTGEYDEWGNPNNKTYYDYMLSYSPYDQVRKQAYPHMLVTTGLHDSQVQYWEPAKWVAKLRTLKTDNHMLLLKTNMEAGHGGASGRFHRLKEIALDYAFLLDLEGRMNAQSVTQEKASP